jgi:2-iminobutanoate/2-iminopropanoate deaminase
LHWEPIVVDSARAHGAYSPAIRLGGLVVVSGQIGADPTSGTEVGVGIAQQTTRAISKIASLLRSAGAELADVVKVTAYLADASDFAAFDQTYSISFPTPSPTRSTVIASPPLPGVLVMIEAWAYVPKSAGSGDP